MHLLLQTRLNINRPALPPATAKSQASRAVLAQRVAEHGVRRRLMCECVVHWCRLDGRKYAVKKIRLQPGGSSSSYSRILREVATLSRLQHPNVVRYYQVISSESARPGQAEQPSATASLLHARMFLSVCGCWSCCAACLPAYIYKCVCAGSLVTPRCGGCGMLRCQCVQQPSVQPCSI